MSQEHIERSKILSKVYESYTISKLDLDTLEQDDKNTVKGHLISGLYREAEKLQAIFGGKDISIDYDIAFNAIESLGNFAYTGVDDELKEQFRNAQNLEFHNSLRSLAFWFSLMIGFIYILLN